MEITAYYIGWTDRSAIAEKFGMQSSSHSAEHNYGAVPAATAWSQLIISQRILPHTSASSTALCAHLFSILKIPQHQTVCDAQAAEVLPATVPVYHNI